MQFEYLLGGGTPTLKKYKMAAGHAAGIVVLVAAAGATGLSTSTTTSFADTVGLTMDAILAAGAPVAFSTVQGDLEYLQTVITNPDAVFKALLVGTAANAQLDQSTVGTASSNGLTAVGTTGNIDPSSPSMDEGTLWYTSGPNANASRKITSVTTPLTATVVMPFAANRIGETYVMVGYTPGTKSVTMSTNLLNVRGDIAAAGADARCIDLQLNGRANSFIELVLGDNIFGSNT